MRPNSRNGGGGGVRRPRRVREPVRVRFAYLTDDDIRHLGRTYRRLDYTDGTGEQEVTA
ncbi:hypothetical protein [Salinispora cortesiana]|uniref:hypothetical protein n=1 Tax=Salinispora cortesiana TaxID=1305843 RepID=UPI0003FB8088|nr:hypothetical protein [Salinispora cortesiana]